MENADYLAFDFGASNARAIAGKLDGKKIEFKEIYRFKTGGTYILGSIYWDILNFYNELKRALKIQAKCGRINTCGIDSWGVDFVLLDKNGQLVSNPFHYRDPRTNGVMKHVFSNIISPKEIFNITGIQFMQINTLFQIYSMKIKDSSLLQISDKLLMISDFFNYLLTGKRFCEYTLASTTQLLDLQTKNWSYNLIKKLNLPIQNFPEIIQPGTKIGTILPSIANETGINKDLTIIAPASHDTASAIASIPTEEKNFIYISSGTWALMGTELNTPNTSENALNYNFTNEGGVFNTIRFLKNINGFWLLQECKRIWESQLGRELSYSDLTKEAIGTDIVPFSYFIYPDHHMFLNPENMVSAIKLYCKKTNQKIPSKRREIVRCILESIAFRYREVYENICKIFSNKFKTIYIIGGGAQNSVLSQFTANSSKIKVSAGPVEATALGNLLMQAYSIGDITSLTELRKIIRSSTEIRSYKPKNESMWDEGFQKYKYYTMNFR
ncbi:MAG: rhamnulokinase [Candidatus Helarchaeota archaeon]